ncbi:MAG: AAA family ATPase [Chitinivibrionales bacterium]|nr:AAA family ATPase [Chitinivibrionales bacterium]
MKLAISGKGGVGKSTVSAALALLLARGGTRVLAVDADPDANLASCLGIPQKVQQREIIPIGAQRKLIEERTGAKVRQYGQMFTLNPDVSDIADSHAYTHEGVSLLVLGAAQQAGAGCACPESVILRSLVSELVLHRNQALILDMEAGIEHLGRATAQGVDTMLAVTEPGQRSVDSTLRILRRCAAIGVGDVRVVVNKVQGPEDEAFVREAIGDVPVLASIPYAPAIRANDRDGRSALDGLPEEIVGRFREILERLSGRES